VLAGLCRTPAATPSDWLDLPAPAVPVAGGDYPSIRGLLVAAGVPFPAGTVVTDEAGLVGALPDLLAAGPVVLKALGRLHKSDAGGVVLGLSDLPSALAAYGELRARLAPPAVSVEQQADRGAGTELIVGVRHDPCFGPVLMVGLGGVFTEVLDDVALALAPVSPATATELLTSLRGYPVLAGARGRPPVDLDALTDLIVRVSTTAAAHPELVELEINPVLATPGGALGLDARAVPRPPPLPTAPLTVPPTTASPAV
jgi:acetate---CoA ligase (ADP-forming)